MFQFKHFSVNDDNSTMKVGTDAVLLGTWIENRNNTENILEIGCGCGVISLILAQRMSESNILAIDIDEDSVKQAEENFNKSSFTNTFRGENTSLQEFATVNRMRPFDFAQGDTDEKFSLIVSNPPFFQNSLKSNSLKKSLARHTETLPFEDLLRCVFQLLTESGRFCCVLPYSVHKQFLFEAEMNNLFCEKLTRVYTKAEKEPQLTLFSFGKDAKATAYDDLRIRNDQGDYSDEYLTMTKDFYLFA